MHCEALLASVSVYWLLVLYKLGPAAPPLRELLNQSSSALLLIELNPSPSHTPDPQIRTEYGPI